MTGPLRILHLEDDPADAELAAATLAADGLVTAIVRVETREAFADALQALPFDVILADYNLPSFDGLTAQSMAAETRPDTPFIFLSGTLGEELAVDRLKAGATDYVLKQGIGRLPSSVRRALADATERAERRRAEAEIRRLNVELEQRVIARTAELARANDALARREADLHDAKSFLEDLIAASPSMIFRLDPADLRVTYASPNVGWLLGYSIEEVVGAAGFWEDLLHPEDRERITTGIRTAIEDQEVQIEQEYRLRGKDGRHRWFYSLVRVEYDQDMRPVTMLRYCLDIAERKAAEEEARVAQRFLDSIVENIPAMIFVKDAAHLRFVRFNRAGEELMGYPRASIIGKNDHDFFPPELADAFTKDDRDVLNRGTLFDIPEETILTRRNGARLLHTKKIPLFDEAGKPRFLLGISEDITERKKADDEIKAARIEAERANHAKSNFLSRMSHDLRTPLNAVLGFAQLLEADALKAEQHENVRQILHGGRHLLALINEVLDIARIESGHLSLSLEPVNVVETVRHAVELVAPLAAQRNVALTTDMGLPGDRCIQADRQRLNQVVLNLLSNGVKYTHAGGRVTVSFEERPERRMRILVTDTGAGIAPEKLKLLFTPFERLGAELTSIEGTGLGLALARGLTQAMGGTLGVTSEVDRGSAFWIELALSADQSAEDAGPASQAPRTLDTRGSTGTVLYIEDNLSNVRLMERVLQRRSGVTLLHADHGQRGIDMARQHRPGLILLDLHLPDLPGEEVLRRLWEDPSLRAIPVAVLSADATPSQTKRLTASGAKAYLTKPLDIAEVLQLIDTWLAGVEPEKQHDHAL